MIMASRDGTGRAGPGRSGGMVKSVRCSERSDVVGRGRRDPGRVITALA